MILLYLLLLGTCGSEALVFFRNEQYADLAYNKNIGPGTKEHSNSADHDSITVRAPSRLPSAVVGERLQFSLPDSTDDLVCFVQRTVKHPDTAGVSLIGDIGSTSDPAGSCMITCGVVREPQNNSDTGTVRCVGNLRPDYMAAHQYELRPTVDGRSHLLTKVSIRSYIDKTDVHEDLPLRQPRAPIVNSSEPLLRKNLGTADVVSENEILDIMVVYTQNAETHLGSAEAVNLYIKHAFGEGNDILDRSRISMRIRAINVVKMRNVGYDDPNNLITTLDQATYYGGSYSEFDYEQAQRYTVQADALVIITRPIRPSLCGIAWLNSAALTAFKMVSVVDLTCLVGYYAFMHELGHNLGAAHDRSVARLNEGAYSYSHGWCWDVDAATSCDNTCRRSLMSYSSCSSSRQSCTYCKPYPYFSNPDVVESGAATGRSDRNNARTINNMKSSAVTLQNSLHPGGLIFSINPSQTPVNVSCFEVRISGWHIGNGNDIYEVTLAGYPSMKIIDQDLHFVSFYFNSTLAVPSIGDVIIFRSDGADTTLKDGFMFHALQARYEISENFDDSMTRFDIAGEGAFYYLDAVCPTAAGGICETFGPKSGDGMFVMVRPDSGGRVTNIASNFSSSTNCFDTASYISVDYYAYSEDDYCYESNFLTIQVIYSMSEGWKTVATAVFRQSSNNERWLTLSTSRNFEPAVVYGVRISANSYSPTAGCSYVNPVALDNINVTYSSECLQSCNVYGGLDESNKGTTGSGSANVDVVFIVTVAGSSLGAILIIAIAGFMCMQDTGKVMLVVGTTK